MKKQGNFLRSLCYGLYLTVFTVYVLLDAFVIPRSYVVTPGTTQGLSASSSTGTAQTTESEDTEDTTSTTTTGTPYSDGKASIELKQYRQDDTIVHVVDIMLSDAGALKTASANNTYGKNITQTISDVAAGTDAVLATNGDYYNARNGYMIRNGVLYRDTSSDASQGDLVIYRDGSFETMAEGSVTATQLLENGVQQVPLFGPALVKDGEVSVTQGEGVSKAIFSDPRMATDQIDDLHYVVVVAGGHTKESAGLFLYQMTEFIKSPGVKTAYNLNGGDSATMVLDGKVIDQPTTGGSRIGERKVSDIIYIG